MRYLKQYSEYKIFENSIADTVEDIILDIRDLGFYVDINKDITYNTNGQTKKGVSVMVENPGIFRLDDIKDCLLRLRSYVDSIGYDMHIDPDGKEMEFLTLEEFSDIYGGEELYMIDIILFEKKMVYPISESVNNIITDIEDILQEIKDERISVNVTEDDDCILVDIETKSYSDWFVYGPDKSEYSEFNVRPAILHLNNYLNDCGYYIGEINDGFDYEQHEESMPTFKSYEKDVSEKGLCMASTIITLHIYKKIEDH